MISKVLILVFLMLFCLFLRFPVYAAILVSAVSFGLLFPDIMPMTVLGTGLSSGLSPASLSCVIFFFLAGEFMSRGGIAEKIVHFLRACIGHVRGALSHINVLESTIFAGISGSSMADTIAMTNILVPSMEKDGYDRDYAVAITLATSNIGPIIPPSSGLILLALFTNCNVQRTIMAGLLPGLLMAGVMLCYSAYISVKRNYPKGEWLGFRNILRTLRETIFSLIMPVIVIVCLGAGIGTVEEVGAGICFYCLFVGLVIDKSLSLKDVWECAVNTAKSVGKILSINAACGIFNWIIASIGLRSMIQEYMSPLVAYPILLMFIIMAIYLIGGCFLSHTILLYVIVPLLSPLVVLAGYDLAAFCVYSMIVCNLGQITPPVGQLIFIGASVCDVPASKLIKELIPFIIVILISASLLIFFPQIATALPDLLYS